MVAESEMGVPKLLRGGARIRQNVTPVGPVGMAVNVGPVSPLARSPSTTCGPCACRAGGPIGTSGADRPLHDRQGRISAWSERVQPWPRRVLWLSGGARIAPVAERDGASLCGVAPVVLPEGPVQRSAAGFFGTAVWLLEQDRQLRSAGQHGQKYAKKAEEMKSVL